MRSTSGIPVPVASLVVVVTLLDAVFDAVIIAAAFLSLYGDVVTLRASEASKQWATVGAV